MKALITAMVSSLVIGGGYMAFAQQGGHEQHQGATAPAAQKAPMMESCKAMKADKEKHMAHMKAMDYKLDGLVAKMDKANGTAKMSATSDVLKELVAQRKSMNSMMEAKHAKMMGHMMQHMQSGKMGDCPMMKGMKDMKGGGSGHSAL